MTIDYDLSDPCLFSSPEINADCSVEQRPKEIRYTYGVLHPSANRAVRFLYEPRPDVEQKYVAGLHILVRSRLAAIEVRGPNPKVEDSIRTYRLTYQVGTLSGRSLLRSVEECDRQGVCLMPTKFEWEMGSSEFERVETGISDVGYFLPFYQRIPIDPSSSSSKHKSIPVPQGRLWALVVLDINGDGRDDILYRKPSRELKKWVELDGRGQQTSGEAVSFEWYFRLAGEGGAPFGPPHLAGLPSQPASYYAISELRPRALDLDGDGLVDIAIPDSELQCRKEIGELVYCYHSWMHFRSTGTRFEFMPEASAWETKLISGTNPILTNMWGKAGPLIIRSPQMIVADIDGDRLPNPIHNGDIWVTGGHSCGDPIETFLTGCEETGASLGLAWHYGLNSGGFFGGYKRLFDGSSYFVSSLDHIWDTFAADIDASGRSAFVFPSVRIDGSETLSPKHTDEYWYRAASTRGGTMGEQLRLLSLPRAEKKPDGFRYLFLDSRGDGNSDALQIPNAGGWPRIALNAGSAGAVTIPSGFFAAKPAMAPGSPMPPEHAFPAADGRDPGLRVIDYNQDGREDILFLGHTPPVVYQQTPNGMTLVKYLTLPGLGSLPPELAAAGHVLSVVLDYDGDGLADFTSLDAGAGNFVKPPAFEEAEEVPVFRPDFYSLNLYRRKGAKADVISVIHDGLAHRETGSHRIQYRAFVGRSSVPCKYPAYCVTRGMTVVDRHWQDTATEGVGDDGYGEFVHEYADGRWDMLGRGWLGFGRSSVTHVQRSTKATREFRNDIHVGTSYPFAHLPSLDQKTIAFPGAPARIRRKSIEYSIIAGDPALPKTPYAVAATRVFEQEIQGIEDRSSETKMGYDSFGNMTFRERRNVGSSHDVMKFTGTYTNVVDSWLLGLLTDVAEVSESGGDTVTRSMHYDYEPTTGDLVHVVRQPLDPALRLDMNLVRNAEGMPTAKRVFKTGDSRWTIVTYNSLDGVEPDRFMNSLGHSARLVHHGGLGVLFSMEDPNGVVTLFEHDRLGRLRAILHANGAEQRFRYTKEGWPLTLGETRAGGMEQVMNYDRLGRPVENRTSTLDGPWSVVRLTYDSRFASNPSSRTLPFFAAPEASSRFEYDNLGRLTAAIHPSGSSTEYEYKLLSSVTRIDERRTRFEHNDLGQLHRTVELLADGAEVSSKYSYGPFGLPTSVTNQKGFEVRNTYDRLGRISEQSDPDMGTVRFGFNEFDEITASIDAAGDATTFARDLLGRVIGRLDKDGLATLIWDTAPNGIGKLSVTTSGDGVVSQFAYDVLSRPIQLKYVIDGSEYAIDTTFDGMGRIRDVFYPAVGLEPRFAVRRSYGPNAEWVGTGAPGGDSYWRAEKRNPAGQLTVESLGNGLRTARRFDPKQGSLVQLNTGNLVSPDDEGTVQSLRYGIDRFGDLRTRTDKLAKGGPQDEIFTYDSMNRLVEWLVPGSGMVSFTYDELSNLAERITTSGAGTDSVIFEQTGKDAFGNVVGPHVLTNATYGGFAYDKNGQQRVAPHRTANFTAAGLPRIIAHDGRETSFSYDAFHNRVTKKTETSSTTYVGGLYEKRENDGVTNHVFYVEAAERAVTQVIWQAKTSATTEKSVLYLHDDLQGPANVVTDDMGTVIERFRYDPFGRRQNPDFLLLEMSDSPKSGVSLGFTGHEYDDEVGLVNMKGRIYDPRAMRFISPDPFVSDSSRVAAFNRYAYVLNNPTRYWDPTGFQVADIEITVRCEVGDACYEKKRERLEREALDKFHDTFMTVNVSDDTQSKGPASAPTGVTPIIDMADEWARERGWSESKYRGQWHVRPEIDWSYQNSVDRALTVNGNEWAINVLEATAEVEFNIALGAAFKLGGELIFTAGRAAEAEYVAGRAAAIHDAAGGVAKYQSYNPTVVLSTAEGPTFVARGPLRQLTLAQRGSLLPGEEMVLMKPDNLVARELRIHPDVRALVHAHREGLTPRVLAVGGRGFCGECRVTIEAFGGQIIAPGVAIFP